jgi:hypothetical protein
MHKIERYIKTVSVRPYAASMRLLAFIPLHLQLQVDGLYQM